MFVTWCSIQVVSPTRPRVPRVLSPKGRRAEPAVARAENAPITPTAASVTNTGTISSGIRKKIMKTGARTGSAMGA